MESDLDAKIQEIEQLEMFKNKLQEQKNKYEAQAENLKKNLATADQLANFYEEEKNREVARI